MHSFSYAWEGIVYAFSTQRNMRLQGIIAFLVIAAAVGLNVTPLAFLHLLVAMVLVMMAEVFNTAIEYAVNLAAQEYDPRAKAAKDIAAGAVLIASAYSVVAGIIVFAHHSDLPAVFEQARLPREFHMGALQLAAVGLFIVALVVGTIKHITKRGTLTLGGPVSGHAAIGFLLATGIIFLTGNLPAAILALAMALLIVQSRIQTGVHSPLEVLLGGILGTVVGLLLFGSLPR
ncbi:MAG: diacylglycerol kinase [Armatimonadetes bacterium]|nr:diacylglycerol kinase [Armatimonadota bacterium]